nr:disintegrin and metalloproteinase domain-containing protein 29-like [Penaeus vannamei]
MERTAEACGGAVTKRTAVYITCTAIPLLLYSVVVLSIALADDCCDYGYDNVAGNFTVPERETAGALFFSGYATLSLGVMFLVTGSVFLCLVSKQNKSSLNIDSTREQEAYPRQLGLQHTQPGVYPQHTRVDVYPQHPQPGVYPQRTRQEVYPPHAQPGVYPQHTQPGVYPQHTRPDVSPQHAQPGVYPQHTQPDVSPQHPQPGVYPQHTQGEYPQHTQEGEYPHAAKK